MEMMTAVLLIVVSGLSFFFIGVMLGKIQIRDKLARDMKTGFDQLVKKIDKLIEGQRLSTILRLEPSSLKVSSQDFEANKPILLTKLLQALEEQNHPQPSTRAYCILEHGGWNLFVEGNTSLNAKNALGRLIVNNDKEGAKKLLEELVDKL